MESKRRIIYEHKTHSWNHISIERDHILIRNNGAEPTRLSAKEFDQIIEFYLNVKELQLKDDMGQLKFEEDNG